MSFYGSEWMSPTSKPKEILYCLEELIREIWKNKQRMEEFFKKNPSENVDTVTVEEMDNDTVYIFHKIYHRDEENCWYEQTVKWKLAKDDLPDEISKMLDESGKEVDITDFIDSMMPPFLLKYDLDEKVMIGMSPPPVIKVDNIRFPLWTGHTPNYVLRDEIEESFSNWRQVLKNIETLEKRTPKKYFVDDRKNFSFKTKFFARKLNGLQILQKFYFAPEIFYNKAGEKIFPLIFLETNITGVSYEEIPAELCKMLDDVESNKEIDVTEFIELELDKFKKL